MRTPEQLRQRAERQIHTRIDLSQRFQKTAGAIELGVGAFAGYAAGARVEKVQAIVAGGLLFTGLVAGAALLERKLAQRRLEKIVANYEQAIGARPGVRFLYEPGAKSKALDAERAFLSKAVKYVGGLVLVNGIVQQEFINTPAAIPLMILGGLTVGVDAIAGLRDDAQVKSVRESYLQQIANVAATTNRYSLTRERIRARVVRV